MKEGVDIMFVCSVPKNTKRFPGDILNCDSILKICWGNLISANTDSIHRID